MKTANDYITKEKKKALEEELEELKGPKRKKILEALAYAKSLGDLKENAEYHQAREDQALLEERILKIEQILRSAQVILNYSGAVAGMGSRVVVQKEGEKEERTYRIVGSEEASMLEGKVSNKSPFGQALLGKKEGDTATFKTPAGGTTNYKVLKVN